jgi:hypothetical protein
LTLKRDEKNTKIANRHHDERLQREVFTRAVFSFDSEFARAKKNKKKAPPPRVVIDEQLQVRVYVKHSDRRKVGGRMCYGSVGKQLLARDYPN